MVLTSYIWTCHHSISTNWIRWHYCWLHSISLCRWQSACIVHAGSLVWLPDTPKWNRAIMNVINHIYAFPAITSPSVWHENTVEKQGVFGIMQLYQLIMRTTSIYPRKLFKKRSIRIINNAGYHEHTNTLFLKAHTLKFIDLLAIKSAQVM